MKTVLITGVYGFLGGNAAIKFKQEGWKIIGLGRGSELPAGLDKVLDQCINGEVNQENLQKITDNLDVMLHFAGSSAVGKSFADPLRDFNDCVGSTAVVLDYMRQKHPKCKLIYSSGATVYGVQEDVPLYEDMELRPVSPYGAHKRMSENLCELYSKTFGLSVAVIRFFSLYGPGLKKQLLWDACSKLTDPTSKSAVFWGNGEETRDWFNIRDAVDFIFHLTAVKQTFCILNAGSAERFTLKATIATIKSLLGSGKIIVFNGETRIGDPRHFWADITKASQTGWKPQVKWEKGISEYVDWYKREILKNK